MIVELGGEAILLDATTIVALLMLIVLGVLCLRFDK